MMRGLPYDAEVEYLEQPTGVDNNNATDYQDFCISTETSIYTASDEVEFVIDYLSSGNIYFATTNGVLQTYTGYQIAKLGNLNANKRSDAIISHSFLYYLSQTRCYVKDLTDNSFPCDATGSAGDFIGNNLWMFSTQNRSGYTRRPRIRLYYLKIRRNGVLVRDFIPVRFTNEQGVSEGAMYDRVTKRLFRNAGTGAFVIGPDKARPVLSLHRYGVSRFGKIGAGVRMARSIPYDAEVEYLESTGTQVGNRNFILGPDIS